jgi:Tfp pilus assembly protein PilO
MNEKQYTIIMIVALALILIAGGGSIYYFQFEVLQEKEKELAVVRGQVADASKKKRDIPMLQKSIAELEKKEAELITHIPNLTRAEYDVFAELLDEMRRKAGVSMSRAGWAVPSRPTPIPGRPAAAQPATVHKIQYDLNVTGTFYQLLRFINLLEQNRRFIGVESFQISKGPSGEAKGATLPKRELRVTIYSYTYKLPPTPYVIVTDEAKAGKSTDLPE